MTKSVKLLALIALWIGWFAFVAAVIVTEVFPLWLKIIHWAYCALAGIATGLYVATAQAARRRSRDV